MAKYLSYKFIDSKEFTNAYDEAPLWSARFGFLLLDNIELKFNQKILDIGSGTGFPLIELAERLGSSSKVYGIDPWTNANDRAKEKVKTYGITNVEILEQIANSLPFQDNSIDLITSNLGINNFEYPDKILKECWRVLKPEGKLALTTNLNGHWKEFYAVFELTLKQLGKSALLDKLTKDQEHRGTVKSVSKLLTTNGFEISKTIENSFEMRFIDGTAFLNHHLVQCGWLETWFTLFPKEEIPIIFTTLEQNLNKEAGKSGRLHLTVPMAFIEGRKT